MQAEFVSLAVIATIAFVAPVIAQIIPRKPIPETVLLLLFGAIFGPHALNVITLSDSINLLSDLGLAFLFLLAGYEIEPKMLTNTEGRKGLRTWIFSFVFALVLIFLHPNISIGDIDIVPMAIVLTTTALGTLMPILREREILDTKIGQTVISFGTWGELGPVLAMAVLLSTRSSWQTAVILLVFVALCVVIALVPSISRKKGRAIYRLLEEKADSTSQTLVRGTILIMVILVCFSALFDLDIVLGAFAAGFVLRFINPDRGEKEIAKLEGIGYGFLIPLFFVISGAKIDLFAITKEPAMLMRFIALLVLVRMVPILISLALGKTRKEYTPHERISVALYCTTALPIIVAVTSLAVSNGTMSSDTASIMVAAGAITVFIMPLLAQLAYNIADRHPVDAVREISHSPHDIKSILMRHIREKRVLIDSDYRDVYLPIRRIRLFNKLHNNDEDSEEDAGESASRSTNENGNESADGHTDKRSADQDLNESGGENADNEGAGEKESGKSTNEKG